MPFALGAVTWAIVTWAGASRGTVCGFIAPRLAWATPFAPVWRGWL